MYIYSFSPLPFCYHSPHSILLCLILFSSNEILKLQMVLVIASTRLMKQIEDVISPLPCGVYGAGTWYYNEVRVYCLGQVPLTLIITR
jgi:hypothetical protein